MATFVLVHGSSHGGWCWKKVIPLLSKDNHEVYTPTLTGLGERSHLVCRDIGLDTHILDIMQVLEYENLNEVMLVSHSYGGLVIGGWQRKFLRELGVLCNPVAGANPVITWNRLISQIGIQEKLPTTTLIRVYALVHAAIYDSLLSTQMQKYNVNNVDEIASIASAASTVMTYLFPNASSSIIQLQNSYMPQGLSANNSTFVKSVMLGHRTKDRDLCPT